MKNIDLIVNHLNITGSISIREAMDDFSMSGGSLTKYISILKKNGFNIKRIFKKHPITGKRYARYFLVK